jgi:hypothetical protein
MEYKVFEAFGDDEIFFIFGNFSWAFFDIEPSYNGASFLFFGFKFGTLGKNLFLSLEDVLEE